MKKIVSYVISAELLFAIFLLGGAFKETVNIPVDLTVLTLVLTFIIAIKRVSKNPVLTKNAVSILMWFGLFVLLMVLSMFYTESPNYYLEKVSKFLLITSWAFLAPFFLLNNRESLKKFIYALAAMSVIASVVIVKNYFTYSTMFVGLSGENYLNSARLIGVGSLSLLVIYLFHTGLEKKKKVMVLILMLMTLIALTITGSRMPVIAFVITFSVMMFFGVKIRRNSVHFTKPVKSIFIVGVGMIPALYFIKDMSFAKTLFSRLSVLTQEDMGASAGARADRFSEALSMMGENFLIGKGIGSYGVNYTGVDTRNYAHNIFLEIGSELGVIGLITFSLMLVGVLVKNLSVIKSSDFLNVWVFSALAYFMLNAMVSGDLNDNRILFAMLGIAAHSISFVELKRKDKKFLLEYRQT